MPSINGREFNGRGFGDGVALYGQLLVGRAHSETQSKGAPAAEVNHL
jgi:hypothetical protein